MNRSNFIDGEYREKILTNIGSIWIYDTLYMFVFPPFGFLAFIGNIISYWIFSGVHFSNKPLYTYLRAICLNSSVINLVSAFNFLWNSRRYLVLSNTEFVSYLRCYFKFPILFVAYFNGCVLDIVLAFERLFELTNNRYIFRRFQPNHVCFVIFIGKF